MVLVVSSNSVKQIALLEEFVKMDNAIVIMALQDKFVKEQYVQTCVLEMAIVYIMVPVIVDKNGQVSIVQYKDVKNHVISKGSVIMVNVFVDLHILVNFVKILKLM